MIRVPPPLASKVRRGTPFLRIGGVWKLDSHGGAGDVSRMQTGSIVPRSARFGTGRRGLMSCLPAFVMACTVVSAHAAEDPVAQFEKEVKPVLEQRCWQCHGPDKQENGLRLDLHDAVLAGGDSGKPAVIPGKSAESEIIKRIIASDPHDVMPAKGERLTAEQITAMKRWIDAGAHWPVLATAAPEDFRTAGKITDHDREFWSFRQPHRSEVVVPGDAAWVRQDRKSVV